MRQTERGGTERTGQLGAFLLALALLLVLTVFAHRVVLGLAAVIAGPLPAARTALSLSRKAMQETVPDETPGSIASEPAPETPGATAATGRMPGSGRRFPAPMVTKIFCTVRGPRASAVTRRLPTPSTSTGPSGGSRARSSAAACSMTPLSRSSSTLTRGTSSVTYRPRGRSSPSRAISTRVTVTPSCRAVATRTPPGRAEQAGAAYNSSAMSVKRMVFPSFSANLPPEALFEPLRTGEVWEK